MNLASVDWLAPVAAGIAAALGFWLWVRRSQTEVQSATPSWNPLPMVVGLALGAFVWFGLGRPLLAVALFAVWQGLALLWRMRARERRAREDERDAVEAIATAGRALRAGIPLPGVLSIVAVEARGRARAAFAEIVQREALGEDLGTSVRSVLLRSELAALRAFGLAIVAQLAAGGNLADTTDRLSQSLIERARVRRRARAIVAYSRLATQVLVALPLMAVVLMSSTVDGYSELLFERTEGNMILGMAAVMLVTGLVLVQRFSRIESVRERSTA